MARRLAARRAGFKWSVIVLAMAAAVILGVVVRSIDMAISSVPSPTPVRLAPTDAKSPPAERCDSATLHGPSVAPVDAVEVSTEQRLQDVVAAHPKNTTYWLSSGIHRLGKGAFNQVIPQTGDTFIGAPGAVLDGGHENRYAFAGEALGVTISFLTVQNFGARGENNNEGVVNHDSAQGWTVNSSTIQDNAGAAVMLGSDNRLTGNCLRDNGQYGFNAYHANGVRNVVVEDNEISGNNTDDWEHRQPGCGCTGGGKFWATNGASITGNYVHDNKGVGLWADTNNVGFRFEANYISANDAEGIMYETSYNTAIVNNTLVRNALVKGPTNPGFPTPAIYLSESGSDTRVGGPYNEQLRVTGNVFVDNWSGIVAWENADRFAGSPANTSTGIGTLVNPSVATVEACANELKIKKKPFRDDCRWKTKNVLVENNLFRVDPTKIPSCASLTGCGFNGLFSNYGTYPKWSPYKADVVQDQITFKQNNVWRNNIYVGNWHFMVEDTEQAVTWDAWRSAPYHQDAGSSMK